MYYFYLSLYIQDVLLPSSRNRNKKHIDITQDYSNRNSEKFSHNDGRQGWNDADTRQTEVIAGELK